MRHTSAASFEQAEAQLEVRGRHVLGKRLRCDRGGLLLVQTMQRAMATSAAVGDRSIHRLKGRAESWEVVKSDRRPGRCRLGTPERARPSA